METHQKNIEDNDYDDDDDDHHEKPLLKALLSELSERLKSCLPKAGYAASDFKDDAVYFAKMALYLFRDMYENGWVRIASKISLFSRKKWL